MFDPLEAIRSRPEPFERYTADDLWTDPHVSEQMLKCHLAEDNDLASRNIGFIDRSVDWICERFEIEPGDRVADFGCGPGLYATRLARRRADVAGIDFSERSIQYAEETAEREQLAIRYVHQNYLEFEPEDRFKLCIMIYCDFCALNPEQRGRLLRTFHRALEPGGSLLFDVHSLPYFEAATETADYDVRDQGGFWSAKPYHCFRNTYKYPAANLVLEKHHVIESARTRTVYNWLQCFSPDTLETELRASGFAVESLYADVAGSAYDPESEVFAVAATRMET